jgi:WD40 repeat protein
MIGPTCARRIGKKRVISTGLISIILIWNVIACKAVTPSATPGPANTSTSTSVSTAILAATLTPEPARLDPVIQLEWTEKQGRINALAWSPDGRILAVASNMGIGLYDPHNTAIPVKSLEEQTAVTQIAFAPDGNSLAVVSDNDVVKLWHLRTGEIEIAARGMVIRFTPAGKLVVAQYHENGVQVFEDVLSSDKSVVLSTRNEPVMFNRDASILALRTPCCTADMAFQLIDTETKDVLVSQWYIDGYSLAFSPDGLQFAYGLPLPNAPDGHHWSNYTATVVLIESRSGIIINTLKGRGSSIEAKWSNLQF